MLTIERYTPDGKPHWDAFVRAAKNGTFLFERDYMDYHADRFADFSLMCSKEKKLVALLPANRSDGVLISHAGLTFGGFLVQETMTVRSMLALMSQIREFLQENDVARVIYKCIPAIYHDIPAEEDRYALFVHGARLLRRDVTSTVTPKQRPHVQERRRRGIRKAHASGLTCQTSDDFASFWPILEGNLERVHGVRPVHTLAEIQSLRTRFPDHIKLFASYRDTQMLAGVIVYEHRHVAHSQYIASSDEGKRLGALDLLFHWLIEDHYRDKRYFDFGISTEDNGRVLNEGLIDFKEGFGARALVHDFYELDLTQSRKTA